MENFERNFDKNSEVFCEKILLFLKCITKDGCTVETKYASHKHANTS